MRFLFAVSCLLSHNQWSSSRLRIEFVRFLESLGDLLTSTCVLTPLCNGWMARTMAPTTTMQPANGQVGQHDHQMDDAPNFGGMWIYPSSFDALPTPPAATDAHGHPLPTNVHPGEVGSRVIYWAHGSAFAITQAEDFVWLFGQMLSEQTGQVVLMGEYALTSSDVFPQQLDAWARTYARLVKLYGASNVILAGDSAGGNLSIATVLKMRDLPPPAGLALFSPWLDLRNQALQAKSMQTLAPQNGGLSNYGTCDYLPIEGIKATAYAYASPAEREGELASPYLATEERLASLGHPVTDDNGVTYHMRVFITWGTAEVLRDQQSTFVQKLRDASVDTTAYPQANMPHDSAVIAANLIYTTGFGFLGVGNYSGFEPTRAWVHFFAWLKAIPGWEAAHAPKGW
uniref:Alpha/beta hydrolase fold-3 domain-containing protein n=1 Tax=Haptolina brevifila TaxID=156173 RepID=A0A7S2MAN8_9EUKA|mmetsp:Transcript_48115/g.95972  ORF Transcript_48115/g.95972 Transcript_48115/m.95972 type:complete len:400 (+) Transcript_48115:91-1290(+)